MDPEVKRKMIALRQSGKSLVEVGRLTGYSGSTVARIADPGGRERGNAASRRWKNKQRGVCEDCGKETHYSQRYQTHTARRCNRCAGLARALGLRGKGKHGIRTLVFLEGGERRWAEIRDHLGISNEQTHVLLWRLRKYGLIERLSRGLYRLPENNS